MSAECKATASVLRSSVKVQATASNSVGVTDRALLFTNAP